MTSQGEKAPQRRPLGVEIRAAWGRVRGGALSPGRAAVSVAVGLFVGALPIYGIQIFAVLAICVPLRLDAAVAYLAAHVSNPLTLPFLLGLEVEVGSLALTGHHAVFDFGKVRRLEFGTIGLELLVGSLLVAALSSLVGGTGTWLLTMRLRDARARARASARQRTLARYGSAPRKVRGYVAGKLLTDPALDGLLAEAGSLGGVVDLGAGYGHLDLALLELRKAESVLGLDADAERIAVASEAALGTAARFERAELESVVLPGADTFLFVDSLHYLAEGVQNRLLSEAARALSPGGRIFVRDVDASRSARSRLTKWLERRAARSRGHRTKLAFRSRRDIVEVLRAAGLTVTTPPDVGWSLFDNCLTVGTKPPPES